MEEKERYIIDKSTNYYTNTIVDTKTNTYYGNIEEHIDLLNQQDKRIKELEETNKVLSNELTKNSILKQDHIETCCGIPIFEIPKMKEENQQLKQQLAEKKKKIADLQSQLQQANEIINNPDTLIFQQQQLIDNLEKTIEEKNKEIERLNACVDFYKSYYISFKEKVIDELEKVKEFFLEEHRDEEMDTDYIITKDAGEIADYLLDQIKQLKEVK